MDKSRKRVEQDYARNAIADGNTKAGKYEAKMAVKEASGEGPSMYGKSKGPKMGAKKGDQSKSRADYAMDSGKTDKGYKGKSGSSKGDQSASKKDYMSKGPKMESNAQEKKNLMKDNPIDSKASKGSPAMNQNKGYGKPMASPMKMTGSWMSKHTKSKM